MVVTAAVAIMGTALGAGDAITAGPAYADVVTNGYTIGTASSAVGVVSAYRRQCGDPHQVRGPFCRHLGAVERERHHYR